MCLCLSLGSLNLSLSYLHNDNKFKMNLMNKVMKQQPILAAHKLYATQALNSP